MANTPRIRKMMEKLEFLVVQDCYKDVETNEYSHVFFPASVWAEKEGCHTNTERRVSITRNAMKPHANSKPDFWVFNQMAKRFRRDEALIQGRKSYLRYFGYDLRQN